MLRSCKQSNYQNHASRKEIQLDLRFRSHLLSATSLSSTIVIEPKKENFNLLNKDGFYGAKPIYFSCDCSSTSWWVTFDLIMFISQMNVANT